MLERPEKVRPALIKVFHIAKYFGMVAKHFPMVFIKYTLI